MNRPWATGDFAALSVPPWRAKWVGMQKSGVILCEGSSDKTRERDLAGAQERKQSGQVRVSGIEADGIRKESVDDGTARSGNREGWAAA